MNITLSDKRAFYNDIILEAMKLLAMKIVYMRIARRISRFLMYYLQLMFQKTLEKCVQKFMNYIQQNLFKLPNWHGK